MCFNITRCRRGLFPCATRSRADMNRRQFLYCHACNAAHHVTPFDTAPTFEIEGADVREVFQDDRRDLMERHSGHRLGELISAGEVLQESGGISDPMRVNYIEVTNGHEVLLIRSSRKSI